MTEILGEAGDFQISSFYGGVKRGKCIQLTNLSHEGHGDLELDDVEKLIMILELWMCKK